MYALVSLLSLCVAGTFGLAFVQRRRAWLPAFAASLALLMYSHNWGLFLAIGTGAAFLLLLGRGAEARMTAIMTDDWKTDDVKALFEAILRLETRDETERFFRDLCTLTSFATWPSAGRSCACSTAGSTTRRSRGRPAPVRPRSPGSPRGSITAKAATAGCSTSSTARHARDDPLPRRRRSMTRRLRLAIPNKGRLVEPTLRLLHDAGLVFEEHDRSLVALVQNYDLDILFVRTNDVIEFVGDGVADLGITGVDLLHETGAELPLIRSLGYGRCRLRRPCPTTRRTGPSRTSPAIGSRPPIPPRPAASSRNGRSRSRSSRSRARSRSRRASAWPKASSTWYRPGRRWSMNGLRQIGDVLASEAILVANPSAVEERAAELDAVDTMLSAVIAARGRKYLMMNAPAPRLAELERLLPALESPTVIPLAHAGHDRDPLGGRGGRRVGSPATAEGGRRIGHPRPAHREDRPVKASVTTPADSTATRPVTAPSDSDGSISPRSPTATPQPETSTRRSSVAGPSPTPTVRAAARATLDDVRARGRRPSVTRTRPSAVAARMAASSSMPRSCAMPATASTRPSAARSTRRSPMSGASPRPSGPRRPGPRSRPASRSSGAGPRSIASAPTSPVARRPTRRRWS